MENCEPMINLSMKTLIRECSLHKVPNEVLAKIYATIVHDQHISPAFKYHRFEYDFADYITLYNNGENVLGSFHPCYDEFLVHTLRSLEIDSQNIVDDDELTEKMKKQIEKLSRISSERQLKEEFPILYYDLTHGRGHIEEFKKIDRSTPEGAKKYDEESHFYYSCGLRYSLKEFIPAQCKLYTRFTNNRHIYRNTIEKKTYNRFMQYHFDMNKIAIYTVSEYLKICEQSDNKETILKYFSLIKKYKESNYDKNAYIKGDNGELISWNTLRGRIEKIEKKLSAETLTVNWVVLPPGYKQVRQEGDSKPKETLLNHEEITRLRKIGQSKNDFYENSPYYAKVLGLLKYKGYIAYVYPNGEVLLDREYDENAVSSATGNAIYCFKAKDFKELSGHTKTFLQNDKRVTRIRHIPNWKTKATEIINREITEESKEEVKKLIKELKEHK